VRFHLLATLLVVSLLTRESLAAGYPKIVLGSAVLDAEIEKYARPAFDDDDGRPLRSVSVDLNSDGVPEKFVPNEFLCGQGGCPWVIFDQRSQKVIGRIFGSVIEVMEVTKDGLHSLEASYSTGAANIEKAIYEFSDGHYQKALR